MISNQPLTISIANFCRMSSLGRTKTYELINEGSLRTTKVGRRTLIDMESVVSLMKGIPRLENDPEAPPSAVSPVHPIGSPDKHVSHVECGPGRLLEHFSDGEFSTQTGRAS